LALATTMAQQGLLTLHDAAQLPKHPPRKLISARPLRHRCVGCGRSCEGHMIGPLDEPFLERLPTILDTLGPLYPDIAALNEPVVDEEHDGTVLKRLAFKAGAGGGRSCVFLGEDRLCRIHRHMGSATKPLICRLFPLELVQTEDGLRVGVGRCYEAHQSYADDAQPEQTPMEITGIDDPQKMHILVRGLDARASHQINMHPAPDTAGWRNRQLEEGWMSLLEQDWTRWSHLYAFVSETSLGRRLDDSSSSPLQSAPFLAQVSTRINACGTAALETLEIDRDQITPGGYLEQLFALLDRMVLLELTSPLPELTPHQRDYGFHVMRETFFLRSWHRHPSFQVSALVGVLGLLVAADTAQAQPKNTDAFTHTLTTWMRYFNHEKHILNLFEGLDDFLALMATWEAALTTPASA
ncbi:MAG: hypothetical protein AAFS10_10800, partial [Myxococcota bacterium]